jgi:hypothetical protein
MMAMLVLPLSHEFATLARRDARRSPPRQVDESHLFRHSDSYLYSGAALS